MHRRHQVGLALVVLLIAGIVGATSSPRDGFGYYWIDQDEPLVDASFPAPIGPTIMIDVSEGGPLSPVYVLPFEFPYYGATYTQFLVSDNGWITFDTTWFNNLPGPLTLPSGGAPPNIIAPLSADLEPAVGANSFWYYEAEGAVVFRYSARLVGQPALMQVSFALFESGVIKIFYEVLNNKDQVSVGIGADPARLDHGHQPWHTGTGAYALQDDGVLMFIPPALLDCSTPETLTCGTPLAATSPGVVSQNVTQYFCSPHTYEGRERVFELTLSQISNVSIALTDLFPATIDLDLLLLQAGECDEFRCLSWSDAIDGNDTLDVNFLPAGTYHLVVDGRTNLDNGAFTVTASCEPRGEQTTCGGAPVSGETLGASVWDTYTGCPAPTLDGPEYLYRVPFTGPGNIRATLSNHDGADLDVLIFAADDLANDRCLAYGDEEANLFNPESGDYIVVVDGAGGDAGSFELAIDCSLNLNCGGTQALECQKPTPGSTSGRTDMASRYSCSPGLMLDGPEAVYNINHAGGPLSFVLEGAPADLRMQLVPAGCNEGECIASGGPLLSADVPAGDYFLVVEGENGAAGDFLLTPICETALEPAMLEVTLEQAECTTESKTVYFNRDLTKVDLLFAVDASVGQTLVLPMLADLAADLGTRLEMDGVDVNYGVVSFVDYVISTPMTCGDPAYGTDTDYPYRLDQSIAPGLAAVQGTLDGLTVENGGDLAESYTRAWHETYTDSAIGWRDDAIKVVLMTGDDVPHECDVSACIGGSSDPWGADPNVGAVLGDANDLEIIPVMQAVGANHRLPLFFFSPTGFRPPGDGLTTGTIRSLWECWTGEGGGMMIEAPFGNVNAAGLDLAEAAIRDSAAICNDMTLQASAGFENWLAAVTPPSRSGVVAPGIATYEIDICVPGGTADGVYDFEVELVCEGTVLASQDVTAAVSACLFDEQPVAKSGGICRGDTQTLDGSSSGIPIGCAAGLDYRWLDLFRNPVAGPAGQWATGTPTYDIELVFDFAYIFQFRCKDQGQCLGFGEVLVPIDVTRPDAVGGQDKSTCIGQPVSMGEACDTANFTYLWDPPTDLDDVTACPVTVNPQSLPAGDPWIDYRMVVTDAQGCTNEDTVRVFISDSRVPAFILNNLLAARNGDDVQLDWAGGALTPREYNVHKGTDKTSLAPTIPLEAPVVGSEQWVDPGAVPGAGGDLLFYQAFQQDCDQTSVFP